MVLVDLIVLIAGRLTRAYPVGATRNPSHTDELLLTSGRPVILKTQGNRHVLLPALTPRSCLHGTYLMLARNMLEQGCVSLGPYCIYGTAWVADKEVQIGVHFGPPALSEKIRRTTTPSTRLRQRS